MNLPLNNSRERGIAAALLFLWALLFLPNLRTNPDWYGDEGEWMEKSWTFIHGTPRVGPIVNDFIFPYPYPPLYMLVNGALLRVFGNDIVVGRALGAVTALAAAALLFWVGSRLARQEFWLSLRGGISGLHGSEREFSLGPVASDGRNIGTGLGRFSHSLCAGKTAARRGVGRSVLFAGDGDELFHLSVDWRRGRDRGDGKPGRGGTPLPQTMPARLRRVVLAGAMSCAYAALFVAVVLRGAWLGTVDGASRTTHKRRQQRDPSDDRR